MIFLCLACIFTDIICVVDYRLPRVFTYSIGRRRTSEQRCQWIPFKIAGESREVQLPFSICWWVLLCWMGYPRFRHSAGLFHLYTAWATTSYRKCCHNPGRSSSEVLLPSWLLYIYLGILKSPYFWISSAAPQPVHFSVIIWPLTLITDYITQTWVMYFLSLFSLSILHRYSHLLYIHNIF